MGKKGTLLRVRELYICNLGGAWSHGRHQRPKTAAAFSERAAILVYDVRVGCVQRCVSNFQAGGLAGKRYQCALLLGAVREWQQRSSDSKRAMNLTSHVRNGCVGWILPASLSHISLCLKASSLDFLLAQAVVLPRCQAFLTSARTSVAYRASGVTY